MSGILLIGTGADHAIYAFRNICSVAMEGMSANFHDLSTLAVSQLETV